MSNKKSLNLKIVLVIIFLLFVGFLFYFSISHKSQQIKQIATIVVGTNPLNITVSGHYAYVANGQDNTISILDISNPSLPKQVATTTVGKWPYDIAVSGHYAYVINDNGLSVVDISNPSAPKEIATASVGSGPSGVAISGSYVYTSNSGDNTLSVVDISNPSLPNQVASALIGINKIGIDTSIGDKSDGIAISSHYAYVTNFRENEISVFDISNPLSLNQIATTTVGDGPWDVVAHDNYLYVTNNNS